YGEPELRRKRPRAADPCVASLAERWSQGCHNGLELWRELQAQGYRGSSRTVYRLLASLREAPAFKRGKAEQAPLVPETPLQHFSAQEAVWLFVRAPTDLDDEERATLSTICQASPTAQARLRAHPRGSADAASTRGRRARNLAPAGERQSDPGIA